MAVSENDLVVGPLTPAAGVTTISLDFYFEQASWLEVYKSGSETPLVLSTDYTVTGAGSSSGVVTLTTPANGSDTYSVYLVVPMQRSSDMQLRGEFKSEPFNIEMDRLWQRLQHHHTLINRKFGVGRTSGAPGPITPVANRVIGFDGSGGLAVAGSTRAELDAAVAFLAGLEGTTGLSDAASQIYIPGFASSVSRSVAARLRDYVSVKDFGAIGDWNGTQTSPGAGTDDTAAIQAAIDYAQATGKRIYFPPGRYRTTAPITMTVTGGDDPINGDMHGFTVFGDGPAASQIVADHNGDCISFTGGSGAGWHTFLQIDGIGLLKGNYGRDAGSVGLAMDQAAFFSVRRFDISFFEYGIDGVDCLSGSMEDGTIRLNNYGWKFAKNTRSHPNNISFRGVITLNNQIWGGQVIQPSLFNYIGGSIESNGFTGTPGDTSSWGVDIQNGGTEGSVAVNFLGVYIEGNNGRADVKILSDTKSASYNFNGCSFLRFQDIASRFTTNNIFFNSITESRLVLSGCGFKDFTPYTSSAAREFVSANNAQVIDGGGNIFLDTTNGNTGINRAIFAPIGTNHQLPFASLPDVVKYRNGLQYCADGTGAALPALAVSDGVRWWQIPLGQFSGNVSSAGAALKLPRGWTCSRASAGVYTVTHNLNLAANTYSVVATPTGAPGTGFCSGKAMSNNSFEIYFANPAGALTDMNFSFNMQIV